MRIAFTIQYNGSLFAGFQNQNDQRTIQNELEKVLEIYFKNHTRVYCAGRTDTGVHAAGQVVHFELENEIFERKKTPLDKIIYHLNCILPDDISIIYGKQVEDDFHARFSCLGREYLYTILNSEYKMALFQKQFLWVRFPLNIEKMQEAANYLIGEKDFAAFTKAFYQKTNEKTIRRIDEIRIVKKHHLVYFYFNGSGFLHNMIRIVTGTLLSVGREAIVPEEVKLILESKDRRHVGKTLPAFPLIFLNARYENYNTPKDLIPYYDQINENFF